MVLQYDKRSLKWMILLLLVLASNFILYRSPLSHTILPEETKWLILSSLIDLAVIAPFLVMAIDRKKGFSIKRYIILMAGGLVTAKFLIPPDYFEPFTALSYVGFAIEGLLLLLEVGMIFLLFKYLPSIIQQAQRSEASFLFSFPAAAEEKLRNYPIIKVVVSEFLMFYYAFMSWRKSAPDDEDYYTLHKKSSYVAFQIMLIHAVVIETIGVHWLFHQMSAILSLIMLILNIYTVIFLIGDIQAVRLNPLRITENSLHISLGLAKRIVVPIESIESITTDSVLLKEKLGRKTTLDFIAKDFDEIKPNIILELNKPCKAKLILGMEKACTRIALRLDSPESFYEALKSKI